MNAHRLLNLTLTLALLLLLPLGAGCTTVSEGTARPAAAETATEEPTTEEPAVEEPADDDASGDPAVAESFVGRTLTVSSWGATVSVPEEWAVTTEESDALRTTKVAGPNGWYIRIDETLEWMGLPDPWAAVNDLGSRLDAKYDDYESTGGRDVIIDGTSMVRWDFSHTSPEGIHLIKADVFFQPSADLAPCAMVIGYPSAEGDIAAEFAEAIIATLDVTP